MEEEIKIMKDYDYFVVNDDIDESLDMMKAIIDTQRCSVKRYGQQEIESYLNTIKKIEDLIN